MKIGDAVRWIGWNSQHQEEYHEVGLIIEIVYINGERRFNVTWPDGTMGRWLYSETIKVVSESR